MFVYFELNLIKDLGYDPDLDQFRNTNLKSDIIKLKIDNFTYDVPKYLIAKKLPEKIPNSIIQKSLYFTRNIIQNRFFIPNNLPFPKSRIILDK